MTAIDDVLRAILTAVKFIWFFGHGISPLVIVPILALLFLGVWIIIKKRRDSSGPDAG